LATQIRARWLALAVVGAAAERDERHLVGIAHRLSVERAQWHRHLLGLFSPLTLPSEPPPTRRLRKQSDCVHFTSHQGLLKERALFFLCTEPPSFRSFRLGLSCSTALLAVQRIFLRAVSD
jgi:hypothetical protein